MEMSGSLHFLSALRSRGRRAERERERGEIIKGPSVLSLSYTLKSVGAYSLNLFSFLFFYN